MFINRKSFNRKVPIRNETTFQVNYINREVSPRTSKSKLGTYVKNRKSFNRKAPIRNETTFQVRHINREVWSIISMIIWELMFIITSIKLISIKRLSIKYVPKVYISREVIKKQVIQLDQSAYNNK